MGWIQDPVVEPNGANEVLHAFAAGVLGLIALYGAGLLILGLLSLVNLAMKSEGIARAFKVYVGYGKVLFTVLPMLLLISVLGLALFEGIRVFSDAADPWRVYAQAGSPRLNDDSSLPGVPLYLIQGTAYALVAAVMAGILSIFLGHFRRLASLPLAKTSRPQEYLAPVVSMLIYLPTCGLAFMAMIGILISFTHGLVAASMHQLSLAPTSLWASVPGLIFAIQVALLFGFILALFTLVISLGLRRTFDSWLSKWYSQGDRLIDKPPPMHLHMKSAGLAFAKFVIVSAAAWGLGRLAYAFFNPGVGLSMVLILFQIVALNAGLVLVRIHKDVYKLFAALTDLFGLHKLYIWTTRNLVVQQQHP